MKYAIIPPFKLLLIRLEREPQAQFFVGGRGCAGRATGAIFRRGRGCAGPKVLPRLNYGKGHTPSILGSLDV